MLEQPGRDLLLLNEYRQYYLYCHKLLVFFSEILVNEPPDEGLWFWNITTISQGAGVSVLG